MPQNLFKLIILSVGFLLLFSCFITAQNLSADVLEDLGFGDLGFYTLGVLYFSFAFSCFIATPIVNKIGDRASMFLGSIPYFLYVFSFVMASASIKYPDKVDDYFFLDKGFIEAFLYIASVLNGFGASILWVGHGRYISSIANDSNKGLFNSVFWAVMMASLIVGALFGAIVLQNTDAFTFYVIMSIMCFLASLFFLLLRPVHT